MSTFFKAFSSVTTPSQFPWGFGDSIGATNTLYTTPSNRYAIAHVKIYNSAGFGAGINSTVYNSTSNIIIDSTIASNYDLWATILLLPGEALVTQKTAAGGGGDFSYVDSKIYEFYYQSPV